MRILKTLIISVIISVFLSLTALATDVYIDGEKVPYDDTTGYPFAENGIVLVPLYPTFEAFGNDGIIQDNPTGSVIIIKDDITVCCSTNNSLFIRNGTKIEAPVGLVWRGGPLYVATDVFSAFDADVYINGSGVIITRDSGSSGGISIFGSTFDEGFRGSEYFGAKREPSNGLYLGCSTSGNIEKSMEAFRENYGKNAAAFTVVADINSQLSEHDDVLRYSIENEKLVRFVLCGVDYSAPDTEKISEVAVYLENSGAKILFEPAPYMTCTHSENFFADYEAYRQSFNIISEIFKRKAPSVALVWQVCTCSEEKGTLYYPGDMYVDYVEASLCKYNAGTYGNLSYFLSVYSYKKPIILEADVSLENFGQNSSECLKFCTYLPVNHPQIKAVFFPDFAESKSDISAYLNAVRSGVSSISYIDNSKAALSSLPYYFEFGNGMEVPASKIKVYLRCTSEDTQPAYVVYKLNGEQVSLLPVKSLPYEAEIDFSSHAGETVSLEAVVYDSTNLPCASKSFMVNVGTKVVSEAGEDAEKTNLPVYVIPILIGICGIVIIIKKINDIFC